MFENPGRKIKGLAVINFWVDIIASAIAALAFLIEEEFLVFLLTLAGGLAAAYVISLLLYGFGNLIEKVDVIAADFEGKSKRDNT